MSSRPAISVIIPTFNRARYLERTICSVLDQGYGHVETILVDGGSTDETADIISRYTADLSLAIRLEGGSTAALINHAMRAARGDIVGVLPTGDLYLPFALGRVADRFGASDKPSWLVTGRINVDVHDRLIEEPAPAAIGQLPHYLKQRVEPAPFAATFWKRQTLADAGDFDAKLEHLPEFEYTCRLLSRGEVPALLGETVSCTRCLSSVATKDRLARQRERSQTVLHYTRHISASDKAHLAGHRKHRRTSAA